MYVCPSVRPSVEISELNIFLNTREISNLFFVVPLKRIWFPEQMPFACVSQCIGHVRCSRPPVLAYVLRYFCASTKLTIVSWWSLWSQHMITHKNIPRHYKCTYARVVDHCMGIWFGGCCCCLVLSYYLFCNLPVQGCGHSFPVTGETIVKTSHKDFQMLIGGF